MFFLLLLVVVSAWAQTECPYDHTIFVTNLNDNGDGSLRNAITLSNGANGAECIRFSGILDSSDWTIELLTELPFINDTVDLDCGVRGRKVVLEGSTSNISCRDTGLFIAFLTIGDPDANTINAAAGSVIRNCRFQNAGQNKNNLRGPLDPGKGPCDGIDVYFTEGVSIDSCEFVGVHGGFDGSSAVGLVFGNYHTVTNNVMENVYNGIISIFVTFSHFTDNRFVGGFPGDTEGERTYGRNTAVWFQFTFFSSAERNTITGYDMGALIMALSADNVIKRNHMECQTVAGLVLRGTARNNAFLDNSIITAHVGLHTRPSEQGDFGFSFDNPVVSNSFHRPAVLGITNTWNIVGGGRPRLTFNDAGDGDVGPQDLQNWPDLSRAEIDVSAGAAWANGHLSSAASQNYLIQCYASDKPQRSASWLLQSLLVQTDEEGQVDFVCDCADNPPRNNTNGIVQCESPVGDIDGGQPLYFGATATECLPDQPVCISSRDVLAENARLITENQVSLTAAEGESSNSRLTPARLQAVREVSLALSQKRSTNGGDKADHRFPHCDHGAPVCISARCPPTCESSTVETGGKHFKSTETHWDVVCPDGETPFCLGSTSEISHMERANEPVTKIRGHSGASKVVVGWAMMCTLMWAWL